jgi:hypothetical protein
MSGSAAIAISMVRKGTNNPTKMTGEDMIGTNPVGRDVRAEDINKK